MSIAAAISRNQTALLRLVSCWLAMARVIHARGDRVLTRLVSRWVDSQLIRAEKAAGFLLIAMCCHGQTGKCRNPALERAALDIAAANCAFAAGTMTIAGAIKRLEALRHVLRNLRTMARQLAMRFAARAPVPATDIVAISPLAKASSVAAKIEVCVPP